MQFRCSVTKTQLISQGCAVDKGTYYCIVDHDFSNCPAGVYRVVSPTVGTAFIRRYIELSTKVWFQGPKGGVKIKKDRSGFSYMGYVTHDPEYIKEFMWAKLKAQTVN
jgi:hypothetical protein